MRMLMLILTLTLILMLMLILMVIIYLSVIMVMIMVAIMIVFIPGSDKIAKIYARPPLEKHMPRLLNRLGFVGAPEVYKQYCMHDLVYCSHTATNYYCSQTQPQPPQSGGPRGPAD